MGATYSPSIDQGQRQLFQDNFISLCQQKQSKLEKAGVLVYLPSQGKTNNLGRMGKIELVEVATRNPDKQYGDYDLDNRQLTKRRFTKTITLDKLYDINELIADPSGSIVEQLSNAVERLKDRIIASAAGGTVLVGAPDTAPSEISAATDGVVTVSATGGISSTSIDSVVQTFINNDVPEDLYEGGVIAVTGKEHAQLMADDNFISNLYVDDKPENTGSLKMVQGFRVTKFAGTDSNITVSNPVLTEASTVRTCLVLCKESVAISLELGDLDISKNPSKVNSTDITIDYWINAMRIEGERVIKVSTTI